MKKKDFRSVLIFQDVLEHLPASVQMIENYIQYLKKRLSPTDYDNWNYLPKLLIPKLLSFVFHLFCHFNFFFLF